MTGSTAVHRALERLDEERDAVAERGAAFEAFSTRVRELPAASPGPTGDRRPPMASPTAMAPPIQTQRSAPSPSESHCVTVREAFDEIVQPHSTADIDTDESLAETIAAELNEDIAVALATETGWTPSLKAAVLEETATRRREVTVLEETLRDERQTLEAAIDEVDEIVAWLRSTADESLLQCDFDRLEGKHEQLETYRDRLEELTSDRQTQLAGSTNRYGPGGTRYRTMVESVYSACRTRYPVLSTATRLYGICGDCQRTVRAHLSRRV
ncbi:DUF7260 family protein [Natrinema salsiterrestre]|uniref:DUF7260 domain-containing protein n=1 Tax=Natrinema salsiterrestre TaxID=2950540 RepID=A0A9Q4L4X5_9EURY|nr:hypothetical protein [Natrinema salsiterrestre]MDF9747712.1 hypothetical protein [Natrinema salsiterrestre]